MVTKKIPSKKFYVQTKPDNCLPTCIKNIMDELSGRHRVGRLGIISLTRIANLCGYRNACGSVSELAVPGLNVLFKKNGLGYEAEDSYGPTVSLDDLKLVCDDENASLVVVSMPNEYFNERILNYSVDGNPEFEHTIIVQSVKDEHVLIYDTLESYYRKSPKNIELKNKKLNTTKFEGYWAKAGNWMMWIKKEKERNEGLHKFFKGK